MGLGSAGFSLRGLVHARTNPRRLKPALLNPKSFAFMLANHADEFRFHKWLQARALWYKTSSVPRPNQNRCVCAQRPRETRGSSAHTWPDLRTLRRFCEPIRKHGEPLGKCFQP